MDKIIRPKILAQQLGVSVRHLYTMMKEPEFPNKVRISHRSIGFKESEINDWIESKT